MMNFSANPSRSGAELIITDLIQIKLYTHCVCVKDNYIDKQSPKEVKEGHVTSI